MEHEAQDVVLIRPDLAYGRSYLEARREGYNDISFVQEGAGTHPGAEDLEAHLSSLNDPAYGMKWADAPTDRPVPFAHLWMIAGDEFLGRVSVRYALTARLLRAGGHIGYEVRPRHRGRGLGHHALALGIEHFQAKGLSRFLLTCRDDNVGSIRIIEAAGGVLEDVTPHPTIPGAMNRRYWITRAT